MTAGSIRQLLPDADLPLVETLYACARDYWDLAEHGTSTRDLAAGFFTDAPPDCDPSASLRLGAFQGDRLAGVAELSFGFPSRGDAYLGAMILVDWARGQGLGRRLLHEVEALARRQGAQLIYLGVLDSNPKGRAFWLREGFTDTGFSRPHSGGVAETTIRRLVKPL